MQTEVAEVVARTTREQAVTDARKGMQELRRRAVEAGRDRSRKIVKTSRIDTRTGEIRYNPAGRLLRDWYLHVYLNTLRSDLGEPAVPIDAQQVEDTTAQLSRLRGTEGLKSLHAVAAVRDVAIDDAAHAATAVVERLAHVATRRAVLHVPDDRFDGEQLAIHVSRHWYQRCYDDHVQGATGSRHPLASVTAAEEQQVALVLEQGQAWRLIGPDGIPLLTPHSTVQTSLDRRLAAGSAGLVSPVSDERHHTDTSLPLRQRVMRTWNDLAPHERSQWLRLADSDPTSGDLAWSTLRPGTQTKIIRLYLDTHRPSQLAGPFEHPAIDAEPRTAAALMFNHRAPLDPTRNDSTTRKDEVDWQAALSPELSRTAPNRGVSQG